MVYRYCTLGTKKSPFNEKKYSKHPHIRTHFSGLRLIVFLFKGCLVSNQPESVLKMFLKLVSEILQTIYYWRFN